MTDVPESNGHTTVDPLPLLQIFTGFQASKTLVTAMRVGLIADLAKELDQTIEQLAHRYDWRRRPAEAFLIACISLGLLRYTDGRYANSALTDRFLVPGRPFHLGPYFEFVDRREYTPRSPSTDDGPGPARSRSITRTE